MSILLLTPLVISTAHHGRDSTDFVATMTSVPVWLLTMSPMSFVVVPNMFFD